MLHVLPIQWFFAAIGAFLIGLSKTGIIGVGILPIALYAVVFPSRASVGLVLPMLVLGDLIAVTTYRRHAVWSHLLKLLPWAAAGVVLGMELRAQRAVGRP